MVVLKLPISGMTTALRQLMSKRGLVPIQFVADIKIGDVGQHNIIVLLHNNAPKYYIISKHYRRSLVLLEGHLSLKGS